MKRWNKYGAHRCSDGIRECYRCHRLYPVHSGLNKVIKDGVVHIVPNDLDSITFSGSYKHTYKNGRRELHTNRFGPMYPLCPRCCIELMSWLTGYGADLRYLLKDIKEEY